MAEIKTVSGSVVTFDDAESGALESLTTGIVATQEGSGTPSPSNVRPISGFDSIKIYRTGKNLFDKRDYSFTGRGLTISKNNDKIRVNGTYSSANSSFAFSANATSANSGNYANYVTYREADASPIKAGTYTVTLKSSVNFSFTFYVGSEYGYNYGNGSDTSHWLFVKSQTQTSNEYTFTFTINENSNFGFVIGHNAFAQDTSYDFEISCQIEVGSTATDYEAYSGTSVEVQLRQTVYGGSLNVKTGELTITHGYIDSYNGESINEPWLSSIDEYVSGGVPTAGAEVVYPLATPITVQLPATTVRAVAGTNTIWSDSGDVEVSYRVYEEQTDSGRHNYQYFGYIELKDGTEKPFTNTDIATESIEITETLYDPKNFRIGGGILPQLKIRFFKSDFDFDFSDAKMVKLIVACSDSPYDRVIYSNIDEDFEMWDIDTEYVEPRISWHYMERRLGEWIILDLSKSNDGKFVDITATKQLAYETEETTGFNTWYDNIYDSQSSVAIKDLMRYWWETYFSLGSPERSLYVNQNIEVSKCFQSYPGIRNFIVWLAELNGVFLYSETRSTANDLVAISYGESDVRPRKITTYQGGTLVYNGYKTITKLVIVDNSRGFRWETGDDTGIIYTITEESNPLIKGIALSDLSTVGTNLFSVISNKRFYDISLVAPRDLYNMNYNYDRGLLGRIEIDGEDIVFVISNMVTTGCQRVMTEISSTIPSIVENGQITSGEVEASYRNYVLYQNNLTDGDVKYLTDGDYLIRTTRVTNLPNTGTTEGFYLIKRTAMNGNAYMLCYGFSTQKLYVGSYDSTGDTLTWIEITNKQDAITGAITPYLQANATADRIIASDANGKLTVSAVGAQALYSAINNISGLTGGKIVVTSSAGGSFVTSTIEASDLFTLYTNITGLTGGNRVVLTSSAGGSLITSSITGTDLSNTVNHVNDDLSTGYSLLSLADGNIASGTTFNFSRQFIIPEKGLYYVHALARWGANATGTRVLAIHSSGTQEVLDDNSIYMFTSNMASPGNMTFIQHLTGLLRVTSEDKYFWIRGWQNSGSTLGTNFRVQFVKLTDSTSVIT